MTPGSRQVSFFKLFPGGTIQMNKGFRFLLVALAVCVLLFAVAPAFSQADRAADRASIKAHIESIFQAFINKDNAALRATHSENWFGYLEGSREAIKGIDSYMDWNTQDPKGRYGMKSYQFREFDMIFKGDAAFVCFVADVESNWPDAPPKRALRICDFYAKNNGKWIQNGSDTDFTCGIDGSADGDATTTRRADKEASARRA
jgi:ketosteroid isomerase-like protein